MSRARQDPTGQYDADLLDLLAEPDELPGAKPDDGPMPLDELAALARALMDRHGLHDWSFAWDRAVRRAGATRWRSRTISLSVPLMRRFPRHDARNTILHEIAHALVGHGHGHDGTWKAKAAEIGARPERCFDSSIAQVDGDWTGTCPQGHSHSRHRAPKHATVSCGICSPRVFDRRFLLTWSWRGVPVLTPGSRVELVGDHEWRGRRGRVAKLLDTRYAVVLDSGRRLRVPFALVAGPRDAPSS
ncbi:SprT-like domain-containing protein [Promicromonospora sp. Marseille-Q5078]